MYSYLSGDFEFTMRPRAIYEKALLKIGWIPETRETIRVLVPDSDKLLRLRYFKFILSKTNCEPIDGINERILTDELPDAYRDWHLLDLIDLTMIHHSQIKSFLCPPEELHKDREYMILSRDVVKQAMHPSRESGVNPILDYLNQAGLNERRLHNLNWKSRLNWERLDHSLSGHGGNRVTDSKVTFSILLPRFPFPWKVTVDSPKMSSSTINNLLADLEQPETNRFLISEWVLSEFVNSDFGWREAEITPRELDQSGEIGSVSRWHPKKYMLSFSEEDHRDIRASLLNPYNGSSRNNMSQIRTQISEFMMIILSLATQMSESMMIKLSLATLIGMGILGFIIIKMSQKKIPAKTEKSLTGAKLEETSTSIPQSDDQGSIVTILSSNDAPPPYRRVDAASQGTGHEVSSTKEKRKENEDFEDIENETRNSGKKRKQHRHKGKKVEIRDSDAGNTQGKKGGMEVEGKKKRESSRHIKGQEEPSSRHIKGQEEEPSSRKKRFFGFLGRSRT